MTEAPLLSVTGIVASYGPLLAVRGASLRLEAGEIVAVLGPNGAGKTTVLKAICNLVPISAGEVLLEGRPITGRPVHQIVESGISLVPEGRWIFRHLTVRENLDLGGYLLRGARARRDRIAELAVAIPMLAERLGDPAGRLSGGQQQVLAIARALMRRPRLLMVDEPTLGLAASFQEQLRHLLIDVRTAGTAILLVEQNPALALGIADRAYVMRNGAVTVEGAPTAVALEAATIPDL